MNRAPLIIFCSLALVSLASCGDDADSAKPSPPLTVSDGELGCQFVDLEDGAVIGSETNDVNIAFEGNVTQVELLADGAVMGDVRPTESDQGRVAVPWTVSSDKTWKLEARVIGVAGGEMTSAPINVIYDSTPPEVSFTLDPMSLLEGEATLPVTIDDNNVVKARLLRHLACEPDGTCDDQLEELATADTTVSEFMFSTTAADDGVFWLQVEVTDVAGHTGLSPVVPFVVVNNGELVETTFDPAAEVNVPANYASVEYHTRITALSKPDTRKVISWLTWDASGDWLMEYSLGQGFCPHRGIKYTEAVSRNGLLVIELAREDLTDEVEAQFPAEEVGSSVFPVNDDPATFGSFFGHIAPLDPADHVEESVAIDGHHVYIY